jgi:hypothetical protein
LPYTGQAGTDPKSQKWLIAFTDHDREFIAGEKYYPTPVKSLHSEMADIVLL